MLGWRAMISEPALITDVSSRLSEAKYIAGGEEHRLVTWWTSDDQKLGWS